MNIDIRHIAKLSRLSIDEERIPKFEREMRDIIALVERLPDVAGESTALDPKAAMPLRKDESVTGRYTRDELLANAPEVQAGCLVVPKTMEQE